MGICSCSTAHFGNRTICLYLQLCPEKETRWYKHIVRLPKWAVEQEQMKEAKWIEEKIFQAVTSNVVQKSKEIRLEEKNGEGDITKRNVLPSTGTDPSTALV